MLPKSSGFYGYLYLLQQHTVATIQDVTNVCVPVSGFMFT